MAKNGAKGGGRVEVLTASSRMRSLGPGWVKRDVASGQFKATKKTGGPFKGVRKER